MIAKNKLLHTPSAVVVHVDDGVLVLVYEEIGSVQAVLGIENALRIDWVVHQ